MKRTSLFAVAMATAGMLTGTGLMMEQAGAESQQRFPFYVIDVNKTFKGYDKYKALTDAFKAEIDGKEPKLRTTEQMIRTKIEAARQFKKQEDRDRVEKEVNELKFNFDKMKRDFQVAAARNGDGATATITNGSQEAERFCISAAEMDPPPEI